MITNIDDVRRGHAHFLADNARLIVDAETLAGRHALTYVQRYSDFKRRTGKLQDTTRYRVVRTSGGRILRIANPQVYAASIDTGSKAHRITAKNAKACSDSLRAPECCCFAAPCGTQERAPTSFSTTPPTLLIAYSAKN
jgi:hypothetical protein